MTKVGIVLAQVNCQLHDKSANLKTMRRVIGQSKGDVVLFPELNVTGYMPRDDLFKVAEPMNGPTVKSILKLAKDSRKDIVFGMPIQDERAQGHIFNSALVATGHGNLFRYDKMYLPNFGPFEERVFFTGGRTAVVADGMHARIGLTVCYDIFFPELAKLECLMGAQLLTNLSASPTTSRSSFDKVLPARAVENGMFVAFTNMVGVHGGLVFSGGSKVLDPRGELLIRAADLKEEVVETEMDMRDIALARRFRPLARDTRPEVLDELRALMVSGSRTRDSDSTDGA
jgi:predicted amidohydrolase